MRTILVAFLLAVLAGCRSIPDATDPGSDAPDRQGLAIAFKDASSYAEAVRIWRSPEDVNDWIGARFRYDMPRAMRLAENQRGTGVALPIHDADRFFAAPIGICVDLSRFAVETLRQIEPALDARYLMIEFSPVQVGGNTLRMHWLASFTRDGKRYFFADSKRPGHIAGPYASTQEFVDAYAAYRNRRVVAFRELDSYQRRQRAMASKQSRDDLRP